MGRRQCHSRRLLWLLVAVGLILLNNHKQAEAEHNQRTNQDPSQDARPDTQRPMDKFILLTTGEDIKLYSLLDKDGELVTSNSPYYVIPKLVKPNKATSETPFNRWLSYRAQKLAERSKSGADARPTPEGPLNIFEEEDFGDSGWQKPLITDVDYLFDERACAGFDRAYQKTGRCLVIIWMDQRNNLIRAGAVDLAKSPLESSPRDDGMAKSKRRFLTLNELDQIDACEGSQGCKLLSLAVDRTNLAVLVALEKGERYVIQKFSLGSGFDEHRWSNQPEDDLSLYINPADTRNRKMLTASITAAIYRREGEFIRLLPDSTSGGPKWIVTGPSRGGATIFGLEPIHRRFIWLNSMEDLRISEIRSYPSKLTARIPAKPTIRSPDSLQLYGGRIYISDRAKKTVAVCQRLSDWPKVKVLLVESPTVLGFRVGSISFNATKDQTEETNETTAIENSTADGVQIERSPPRTLLHHLWVDVFPFTLIMSGIIMAIYLKARGRKTEKKVADPESNLGTLSK